MKARCYAYDLLAKSQSGSIFTLIEECLNETSAALTLIFLDQCALFSLSAKIQLLAVWIGRARKAMQEYIKKEEFEAFQSHVLSQFRDIVELFCKQQAHMERHLECTERTQKHLDTFVARMDHLCQFIQSVSDTVDGKPREHTSTSRH